jgi:hypothetical protein
MLRFIVFLIFGLSMVLEKSSLVRRFLSYRVKPNHSHDFNKKIHFTYKCVILNIKRKNDFFGIFEILA